MEGDHSDNNSNCSGGKKNAHAKIGIFLYVLLKHCLEGTSVDYLVLCPEAGCLGQAGIGCVWHRAVPASLHRDPLQLP